MELKRTVLVAVTVGVTALGTVGCKGGKGGEGKEGEQANETAAAAPAPPPAAAPAPAATAAATATAEDTTPVAPPAPAADQAETPGPAPSPSHVWIAGNWHYDWPTRHYEWVKGYWLDKNAFGSAAPPPEVVEEEGVGPVGYAWHPGYHYWDGHAYQWRYGYWHNGRPGFDYVHPYYENLHGHWQTQAFGWTPHAEFVTRFKTWVPHNGVFVHPEYLKVHEAFRTQHAAEYKVVERFTYRGYKPH
jgi:hypothetical protein